MHRDFLFHAFICACVVAAAALGGCFMPLNYNGISTKSRFYDPKIAFDAGLNQAQTTACENEGRAAYVGTGVFGTIDGVAAGNAYEACVARVAKR